MTEPLVVDCTTCTVRGAACSDCVMSVLLGPPERDSISFSADETRAMAALSFTGLVPPLRHAQASAGHPPTKAREGGLATA